MVGATVVDGWGFEGFVRAVGVAGGADFGFALAVGGFGFFEDVEEVFALVGDGVSEEDGGGGGMDLRC